MALFILIGAVIGFLIIKKMCIDGNKNTGNDVHEIKPGSGCKSSFACQHSDLGRAGKEGKSDDYTYCKYVNDFVKRKDNCDFFLSHGCANGICAHANIHDGVTYCKYYECNVVPSDSCQDYVDYFNTPDGENFRNMIIQKVRGDNT